MLGFSIADVDRLSYLVAGSISVQRQQMGRGSASFELTDKTGAYRPSIGDSVLISDGETPIFGGLIDRIKAVYVDNWHRPQTYQPVRYSVDCVDWAGLFDRRVIARHYPKHSIGTSIIVDIIENFLDGTGFDTSHVNGGFFLIDSDLEFNYSTVTEAFNRLADMGNGSWWVTPTKELYFSSRPDAPTAPFAINYSTPAWSGLEVEYGNSSLRTREFLRTNINLQAGTFTETYTIDNPTQSMVPTKFPLVSLPTLTLDGVPQTVLQNGVDEPGQDAFYAWLPGMGVFHGQTHYIPEGTVAVITYGSFLSNVVEVDNNTAIAAFGKIDMVDEVKDLEDYDIAKQLAQAILDRKSRMGETIRYETMRTGLSPGMAQYVSLPDRGIAGEDFWIDSISSQLETLPAGVALPDGSHFRHSVTLTNAYNEPNWQKWFESMVTRTKQGKAPIETEAHGWSFSSEVVLTDTFQRISAAPVSWQHNGILWDSNVSAEKAPIGQDLEIDIRRVNDGASIFVAGTVGHYLKLARQTTAVTSETVESRKTFAVNPWEVLAGETYELWMRYTPYEEGVTSANAFGVKIQIELNH